MHKSIELWAFPFNARFNYSTAPKLYRCRGIFYPPDFLSGRIEYMRLVTGTIIHDLRLTQAMRSICDFCETSYHACNIIHIIYYDTRRRRGLGASPILTLVYNYKCGSEKRLHDAAAELPQRARATVGAKERKEKHNYDLKRGEYHNKRVPAVLQVSMEMLHVTVLYSSCTLPLSPA